MSGIKSMPDLRVLLLGANPVKMRGHRSNQAENMALKQKDEGLRISEDEYLQGELISDVKHEYIDGIVYAMAGASKKS
jgi:hypothetical protein